MPKTSLKFLLLPLVASMPYAAIAQQDDPIIYTVKKGDTLIGLGEKFLNRPDHYKVVQRVNKVRDPYRMPVGMKLAISRTLLKYQPANARLVSVRGQVTSPASGQFANGAVLSEGATLVTAASSFATLLLDDGSRISVPSNSSVKISRLRSYVLGGSLDYDFDVGKGELRSNVRKLQSADDRYRVRTPKAVSAVRGTDFQSRFDEQSNNDFAEVVEGALAVSTGGALAEPLPAGNGLAVSASGMLVREPLLPAPALATPIRPQVNPLVRFSADKSDGASAYRFSIGADAGFVEQVADIVSTDGKAEFAEIPNGNYFLRVRARSAAGIEGQPATFAFKRRLNSVSATAGRESDGYVFRWLGEGDGKRSYHFQLFRNATDIVPIVDEAGLSVDRVILSDLPAGDYFWRVGAVQYLDGEASTNWTEIEKLSVSAS